MRLYSTNENDKDEVTQIYIVGMQYITSGIWSIWTQVGDLNTLYTCSQHRTKLHATLNALSSPSNTHVYTFMYVYLFLVGTLLIEWEDHYIVSPENILAERNTFSYLLLRYRNYCVRYTCTNMHLSPISCRTASRSESCGRSSAILSQRFLQVFYQWIYMDVTWHLVHQSGSDVGCVKLSCFLSSFIMVQWNPA